MQTRLTDRPIHQVIAGIEALDLEPVMQRMMDAELGEDWTREYAESVGRAYRNYLTMLASFQEDAEDIVLSRDVDEFWHTHILQTIKYTEDCERVFGRYLHHNPHIGERKPEDLEKKAALTEKTRRLYQQKFGAAGGAAWAGAGAMSDSAWSSAAIRTGDAAWSSAAMRSEGVAWSSAAIKAAAWSSAAIRTENAAWSSVAIKAENAAWSSAAILPENAAWSSVAVRPNASARVAASAAD
ncbi:MAG: hypothetical protein WBO23_10195 [Burkholderiales bacterium]